MPRHKDHYHSHRIALKPLLPDAGLATLEQSVANALEVGEDAFIQFLLHQGLGPSWDELIHLHPTVCRFSKDNLRRLHQSRLTATADYLLQKNFLSQTRRILDQADIPHATIKGAHTRERYFDTPSLRVAVDQDVLISPEKKVKAIRAFQSEGFTFHGPPQNISHECSLIKGKRNLDLHWDILRPGRTRIPMITRILGATRDFDSHRGPDDNATLYLLLVHPVFTKYITTPHASLVRLLDIIYLLRKGDVDWKTVINWLDISGLKTAAWLSITWLKLLTDIAVPDYVTTELQPGRLRQHYLMYWLSNNLPSLWLERATRIQLGFTLPAHDQFRDAWRAAKTARFGQKAGPELLASLQNELS